MFQGHLDIPLSRDGSARFLPWIIALMVYLASLALAGTLVLDEVLARWDRNLAGTLTVQIPPPTDESGKDDGGLGAALQLLQETRGVTRADLLSREATARLLEPWLGTSFAPNELALPRLIDLHINPAAPPDLPSLRTRLADTAPGAVLDDHRVWLDRLANLVLSIEITAIAIVVLIGAAAALTVVFTTRAGLAVHHPVIEVMHLIGARDGYIAAQFQGQALRLGLRGGLLGFALTAMTLLGILYASQASEIFGKRIELLPTLELAPWHWIALALPALVVALIAMITARLTVLRALARLP